MIRPVRSLSIRNKIILIALAVTFLAMSAGVALLVVGVIRTFRRDLLNNTVVNAGLTGEYCITPLLFEDRQGARDVLMKLGTIPSIQEAFLFDDKDRVFALFTREGPPRVPAVSQKPSKLFQGESLQVTHPIFYKGVKYGTIVIVASTEAIDRRIKYFVGAIGGVFLFLMGLATLVASKLEGLISRPILHLARVSGDISEKGDYAIRVKKAGNDEIGLLYDRFNGMLEQIERRTREREQLNGELELKNKELEQIIYVASHDLRSPLINIQGFTKEIDLSLKFLLSSLHGKKLPDHNAASALHAFEQDLPGHMDTILNSVRKMDTLLKGLLRVSRLGRDALNVSVLDLGLLLTEVLNAFQFKILREGISVVVDPLPPCLGDPAKINQVFSNLIDNALKYRDKARPLAIHISGKTEADRAVYCVEDNGIGIAPDHHKKIFEIFHRLSPGETEGEGLGLTIVSKIVARHHGAVWVESAAGSGSRFFVALPVPDRGGAREADVP